MKSEHFYQFFNENYHFYVSVYYWQSLRCVSRYIIPETGYMTATSALEVKISCALQ